MRPSPPILIRYQIFVQNAPSAFLLYDAGPSLTASRLASLPLGPPSVRGARPQADLPRPRRPPGPWLPSCPSVSLKASRRGSRLTSCLSSWLQPVRWFPQFTCAVASDTLRHVDGTLGPPLLDWKLLEKQALRESLSSQGLTCSVVGAFD